MKLISVISAFCIVIMLFAACKDIDRKNASSDPAVTVTVTVTVPGDTAEASPVQTIEATAPSTNPLPTPRITHNMVMQNPRMQIEDYLTSLYDSTYMKHYEGLHYGIDIIYENEIVGNDFILTFNWWMHFLGNGLGDSLYGEWNTGNNTLRATAKLTETGLLDMDSLEIRVQETDNINEPIYPRTIEEFLSDIK